MQFIKDDPEKVPGGYGPRLTIKFPHHPKTSKFPEVSALFSAMERLCCWGGYDKAYRAEANESNNWNPPIVLSWEFSPLGSKFFPHWLEAIETLKLFRVTEVTDRESRIQFLDGFR